MVKMVGKNVAKQTTIPSEPTVVLMSPIHPCMEFSASLSAPPTTGTKLPNKNLVVLVPTVSAEPATSPFIVKRPTNIVNKIPSVQITTLRTAAIIPEILI